MLVDKTYLPLDSQKAWSLTPARIVAAAKSSLVDADAEVPTNAAPATIMQVDFSASALVPDVHARIMELTEAHVIVDMAELHHGWAFKFPLDTATTSMNLTVSAS